MSTKENVDRMTKLVIADLEEATPGERAIIGMLGLILSHLQEQACEHKAFAEQFNRLTSGGNSMMVTAS